MKKKMVDAVLELLDQGFSVIPISGGTKKPHIPWAEFQKRLPTEDEVCQWWEKWPNANVGIVTGRVSNLAVVDGDGDIGTRWIVENMPKTSVYVKTGREGGCHCYYRVGDQIIPSKNGYVPKVDLKAEGGYVVAPPSVHANGNVYTFVFREGLNGFADMPTIDPGEMRRKTGVGNLKLDLSGIKTEKTSVAPTATGGRNSALAAMVGKLVLGRFGIDEAMVVAKNWNASNSPPLGEKEVEQTVKSVYKTHIRKHPEQSSQVVFCGEDLPVEEEHSLPAPFVHRPQVDGYPSEILQPGGLLQEIMDYTEDSSPAALPLFSLAAAIAVIGSLAGMKVQTETGLKTNMYVMSLGYSGTGKDAPNKAVPNLLQFSAAANMLGPNELASSAGIQKHLAMPNKHCTLLMLDEMGLFFEGLRNPTSPLADFPRTLTRLFSSAGRPERKVYADDKMSYTIPWHHLSVHGCSNPQSLWTSLGEGDTVNGFLARWLVFESLGEAPRAKKQINIADLPKKLIEKLCGIWKIITPENPHKKNMGNLVAANDDVVPPWPHVIPKDSDAAAFFDPFDLRYHELKNKHRADAAKSSIYGRAAEHAHKLALIHAVSLHGEKIVGKEVGIESVAWAMKVAEASVTRMVCAIEDNIATNDWHACEQKITRLIKKKATQEKPGVTMREIKQFLHLPDTRANELVRGLVEKGDLFKIDQKTGNRNGVPRVLFCVPEKG